MAPRKDKGGRLKKRERLMSRKVKKWSLSERLDEKVLTSSEVEVLRIRQNNQLINEVVDKGWFPAGDPSFTYKFFPSIMAYKATTVVGAIFMGKETAGKHKERTLGLIEHREQLKKQLVEIFGG